jgi:hypothetical protein
VLQDVVVYMFNLRIHVIPSCCKIAVQKGSVVLMVLSIFYQALTKVYLEDSDGMKCLLLYMRHRDGSKIFLALFIKENRM